METRMNSIHAEPLRCETCLYWEDFNGVCFCGASPYQTAKGVECRGFRHRCY